ncbi:MAG: D-aminoacylase, partial [Planctomycetota bacterium]
MAWREDALLLVRGGTVVTASGRATRDVLVRDGVIAEIGESLHAPDARVVDARGRLVTPGFVDIH